MRIMKFDEKKLNRLRDSAEDAHVALQGVSEHFREVRAQLGLLNGKVARNRLQSSPRTANQGDVQEILRLEDEQQRLKARRDRLQLVWESRSAVVTACREWAQANAGMKGAGAVMKFPGHGGWIK